MGVINIDNIEPGMVLAMDVKDRAGRILMAAGNEVTEKHLRIFRMWGVTEADVQGVEMDDVTAKATMAVDPEQLRRANDRMQALFVHANTENPFMKELLRLATLRAASQPEGDHGNSN